MSDTRCACCMLWVTITTVTSWEIPSHDLLNTPGRGRVERRAGLVHQEHSRAQGQAAGDAESLLLPAGEVAPERLEPVAHLVLL